MRVRSQENVHEGERIEGLCMGGFGHNDRRVDLTCDSAQRLEALFVPYQERGRVEDLRPAAHEGSEQLGGPAIHEARPLKVEEENSASFHNSPPLT